jgi:transposase-like protein
MTSKSKFAAAHFHNEDAARAWFETARWPDGPTCPHCGSLKHYANKAKVGVYRCGEKECRKDYTVMTKSVMERSHAKLHQWAVAFHMAASSKKGFSAHQLHRELGCEYNTAWFMWHRVREAMRRGGLELPLGSNGEVVEADETYFGWQENPQPAKARRGRPYTKGGKSGPSGKRAVVALVERGGSVRSFHPATTAGFAVAAIVRENIAREARLMTDESQLYVKVGSEFASHETVKHSAGEYVRREMHQTDDVTFEQRVIHTNTVENYFSVFKRGMRGTYQHCKEKHLHRYLAEFDFRYNTRSALGYNDEDRAVLAVRGGEGKRLTYRQPH